MPTTRVLPNTSRVRDFFSRSPELRKHGTFTIEDMEEMAIDSRRHYVIANPPARGSVRRRGPRDPAFAREQR